MFGEITDRFGRTLGYFFPWRGGFYFLLLLLLAVMACVAPVVYSLGPIFLILGLIRILYAHAKGDHKGAIVGWISWSLVLLIYIFWCIDDDARAFTWGFSRTILDIFFEHPQSWSGLPSGLLLVYSASLTLALVIVFSPIWLSLLAAYCHKKGKRPATVACLVAVPMALCIIPPSLYLLSVILTRINW
jgi:hypothetical protein